MITQRQGTVDAAILCLERWFGGHGGNTRAYDFFIQKVGKSPWKPLITKSFILPKHRFALWLFSHENFLTRDRLPFVEDKGCTLCKAGSESMAHLFFDCPISKGIWEQIRVWLGMRKIMGSSSSVLKAYRGVYRGNSMLDKMRSAALAATVYHIWNARNRALFENEDPNTDDIIFKIKIVVFRCLPNSIDAY